MPNFDHLVLPAFKKRSGGTCLVDLEVTGPNFFFHLAFPRFPGLERRLKNPSFDDRLMASLLTCTASPNTVPD